MSTEQLLLPGLQSLAGGAARTPRQRRRISALPAAHFPIALNCALAAENLSFATYAIMLAARQRGRVSIAQLALDVGYSYHATRNQVIRTQWWEMRAEAPLSTVELNGEGSRKLDRVSTRLARHAGSR